MVSSANKSVTKPQFHVAISGEGKLFSKDELTEIAIQWMERMGYGDQPYLVIYQPGGRIDNSPELRELAHG